MKVSIHIPTVQFGFILVEGEEKDLPKMIELHNKYCTQKIAEPKTRQVNPYKGKFEGSADFLNSLKQ
jgi:hypothetical protein